MSVSCVWQDLESPTGGRVWRCRTCKRHGGQVQFTAGADDAACRKSLQRAVAAERAQREGRDRMERGGMDRAHG